MMKTFQVRRRIEASPDAVWRVLVDGDTYPEWEPNVERIEGRIAPGESIAVHTRLSPGRAFPVKVTEFVPGERMVWSGGLPLGLFKGVRTFLLMPAGTDATDFNMNEVFSGPLLAIFGRTIPDLTDSFEQFADGLKARAERSGGRS